MTGLPVPDCDAIYRSLGMILASETFSRSERLRSFLAYVVENERSGKAHLLKGYTIGIDVFLRPSGFDAGNDPLVRVQAGKLRKLLDRYYEDEGVDTPVRISIPLGSYVPDYVFQRQAAPPDVASADPAPEQPRYSRQSWVPAPVSSHLALLSLLPLIFLAPAPASTMRPLDVTDARLVIASTHERAERGSADLPALRIQQCWPGTDACRPLADAIAASARYYDTVDFDRRSTDAKDPLAYTVRIENKPGDLAVYARLVHDASGETIHASYFRRDDLRDETGILHEAVSFVARTLSADGRIYRHALRSGVASALMRCLAVVAGGPASDKGGSKALMACASEAEIQAAGHGPAPITARKTLIW